MKGQMASLLQEHNKELSAMDTKPKYCIYEYMVAFYFVEQPIFFPFLFLSLDKFLYREKIFVKMKSVLTESTNKVGVTHNKISHIMK